MNLKLVFTGVNILSLFVMFWVTLTVQNNYKNKKEEYVRMLRGILFSAGGTLFANIFIANAMNMPFAYFAYCFYYAEMDWIVFHLCFFSVSYVESSRKIKRYNLIKKIAVWLCLIDNCFIYINLFRNYMFEISNVTDSQGVSYYISNLTPIYNIHLGLDYIFVLVSAIFLIVACVRNYSFYRLKYISIISIVMLIVVVNIIYLAFSLYLDWSVFLYALAGFLVYYFSMRYVPNHINSSFFGLVAKQMKEGLIIFDKDDKCVYINEACIMALNISNESFNINKSEILSLLSKDELSNDNEYMDYSVVMSNNELKQYKVSNREVCDNQKHKLGSFYIFEDVTEEYKAIENMGLARKEADEANKAKSVFLANMSHEIRTPINAVLGMNEMILRDAEDEKILGYASNAMTAGQNLLILINDILDFSKIEAGKLEIIDDDYSLHELSREIYLMLLPKANVKDLDFDITMTDEIPCKFFGDRKRVMQVMLNIINNAVKYTREGSVKVNISHKMQQENKALLTIEVTDTGIGISKENQAKLFNAFQRVDQNKNRNIEGTGLGLAIAKQLAEKMGGTITIVSEEGKGSVFTITLVQTVTDSTANGQFNIRESKKIEKTSEGFLAPDASILVVDDIEINLVVVQALLERNKIQVYTATGG